MSLRPRSGEQVPSLTVQTARASNPGGTTAMWVRDRLDGLRCDEDFADWYPRDGRPDLSPTQLATVCVLQFLLDLSDRQAAEAVRCRIDSTYALAMELDDPGFHHSVLADFRERLTQGDGADGLFDLALAPATPGVWRGGSRTPGSYVNAHVPGPNRVHNLPRKRPERGLPAASTPRPASTRPHRSAKARPEGRYVVRSKAEGTVNEFAHGHGRRVQMTWQNWLRTAGCWPCRLAAWRDGRGTDRAGIGARVAHPPRSFEHRGTPAIFASGAPGFHPEGRRRAGGVAAHCAAVGDEEARSASSAGSDAGPGDRGSGPGPMAAPNTGPSACTGRS